MKHTRKSVLIGLLCISVSLSMTAQETTEEQEEPPKSICESVEKFNDFDFWVGEWIVYTNDEKRGFQGTNSVTKHHQNCLIMENWNEFSFGPSGIANIPRPGFFGVDMNIEQATIYVYFLMIGLSLFTIFVVNRLQASRIGRAWIALREDEIACQAMGIDKAKTKLTAFALGATWAGMVGVVFAAKTTFINPASFTFMESAIILSITSKRPSSSSRTEPAHSSSKSPTTSAT